MSSPSRRQATSTEPVSVYLTALATRFCKILNNNDLSLAVENRQGSTLKCIFFRSATTANSLSIAFKTSCIGNCLISGFRIPESSLDRFNNDFKSDSAVFNAPKAFLAKPCFPSSSIKSSINAPR